MKSPVLKNDSLAAHQSDADIVLLYKITGAKAGSFLALAPLETHGYDAPGSDTAALGQTTIDNLLGSSSEFVAATAFGSTAMGTDALAFVLDCSGQLKYSDSMYMSVVGNVGGTAVSFAVQAQTSALPNTLAAPARLQVSSAGNVAAQIVISGLDAATAGLLVIRIGALLK